MGKTAAERVRHYMARKRANARQHGLCTRCCKERPNPGRTICHACHNAINECRRRRRARSSDHVAREQLIAAHERAGNIAHEHNFHDGATQHYRDALAHATNAADRARLSGKLARTLLITNNTTEASRFLDGALSYYSDARTIDLKEGAELVELLLQRNRQSFMQARPEDSLSNLSHAMNIAHDIGNTALYRRATLRLVVALMNLERRKEARLFFESLGDAREDDSPEFRFAFFYQRAMNAARKGERDLAYADFERGIAAAEGDGDSHRVAMAWNDFGRWAKALGDTELAKANLERALLIARHNQILTLLPYACLEYTDLLTRMGQYSIAHHYLKEALTYSEPTPAVEMLYAEVGIRLALEVQDDASLAKCANLRFLTEVWKTNSAVFIAPVVAAFARLSATRGNPQYARKILHRALRITNDVELKWDLCLEVARQGSKDDISAARELFEVRTKLPEAKLSSAYLNLFDAFVAQRQNQEKRTQQLARDALKKFENLQWYAYADLARALLPAELIPKPVHRTHRALVEIHLTAREHEVASLVLKGLTNRAIGKALSLSEKTVEGHMASIMGRLGIRSRHQLAEALPESELEYRV